MEIYNSEYPTRNTSGMSFPDLAPFAGALRAPANGASFSGAVRR